MFRKISLALALVHTVWAQTPVAKARFHHLHLNSTDPETAVSYYTTKFEAEKRTFGGASAVWANNSWLLFSKVPAPPKSAITSSIWHMGWGGGDNMKETYRIQVAGGTKFQTPLTDLTDQCDGKGGTERFLFAYVDGPDHALIELNTTAAGNQKFGHVHLLSDDPVDAGEWYMKHFGLTRRGQGDVSREPRFRCGRQTGPSFSMMMDDVNVIVYPVQNAQAAFPDVWKNRPGIESTAGHTIDHLGFAVDRLEDTIVRLRRNGVLVISGPRQLEGTTIRTAMVQGPDRVRIELLEGQ